MGAEVPLCPNGCNLLAHRANRPHVFTGKKIWMGSEVYSAKRLRSDELREDTENAMLNGNGYGLG